LREIGAVIAAFIGPSSSSSNPVTRSYGVLEYCANSEIRLLASLGAESGAVLSRRFAAEWPTVQEA
jgi:hypothetical protein